MKQWFDDSWFNFGLSLSNNASPLSSVFVWTANGMYKTAVIYFSIRLVLTALHAGSFF